MLAVICCVFAAVGVASPRGIVIITDQHQQAVTLAGRVVAQAVTLVFRHQHMVPYSVMAAKAATQASQPCWIIGRHINRLIYLWFRSVDIMQLAWVAACAAMTSGEGCSVSSVSAGTLARRVVAVESLADGYQAAVSFTRPDGTDGTCVGIIRCAPSYRIERAGACLPIAKPASVHS
jgi:hypothetical protein